MITGSVQFSNAHSSNASVIVWRPYSDSAIRQMTECFRDLLCYTLEIDAWRCKSRFGGSSIVLFRTIACTTAETRTSWALTCAPSTTAKRNHPKVAETLGLRGKAERGISARNRGVSARQNERIV